DILRDRGLSASLVSLMLVSAIMMTTLVVGPFYLSEALGLRPEQTGLVMSLGPAVVAVCGLPAGRLVDRLGSSKVMLFGLLGVLLGAMLMTILPVLFGTVGYIGGLVFITAGYALFQAANNTGIMAGAAGEQKGVISALLGLSRNLGLITGASAMGAVYSFGSRGLAIVNLAPGSTSGFQISFALAVALATGALVLVSWATKAPNLSRILLDHGHD
ncbi:MAG: MFS transporter, partial [Sphingobacteriales bacterium]